MPRDSNGNYSLPAGTIVASGETILPSQHNPAMQDIAQSMSNSLSRDGQGPMRAPLDMGGNGLTNIGTTTFTGAVYFGGINFVAIVQGGNSNLYFTPNSYITFDIATTAFNFAVTGTARFSITASGASVNGTFDVSGAMRNGGNQVWHAGNFNPGSYQTALGFTPVRQGGGSGQLGNTIYIGWSGTRLKGQVDATDLGNFVFDNGGYTSPGPWGATQFNVASNFYLGVASGRPSVVFGSGALVSFDAGTNKFLFFIGGTAVASVDAAGSARFLGNVTANAGSL